MGTRGTAKAGSRARRRPDGRRPQMIDPLDCDICPRTPLLATKPLLSVHRYRVVEGGPPVSPRGSQFRPLGCSLVDTSFRHGC